MSTVLPPEPGAESGNVAVAVTETMRDQVTDAMSLFEHAIESGFRPLNDAALPTAMVNAIKTTAALVGTDALGPWRDSADHSEASASAKMPAERTITVAQWVTFEMAYHELAVMMTPVTAQTLRNTDKTAYWLRKNASPAQRFAGLLWVIAIAFALVVIAGQWGLLLYGPGEEGVIDMPNTLMQLSHVITPYAFGGLGACVYLLRSAHQFIHERTFDLRRKPEYFNRVLLGAIGGGAIILFIDEGIPSEGAAIRLSAAALGFLAGYSTDFLFNTIERVISAILPKVGLETVRRAPTIVSRPSPPTLPPGLTLKDLLDRYQAAQGEEKVLYRSLIEQFFRPGGS